MRLTRFEVVTVTVRRTLLWSLDARWVVIREFLNPAVSRSGLDRCLHRHEVSKRRDLIPKIEGELALQKPFKDYLPGLVHIDIKYLPQMADETARCDRFVAIDRATRWGYLRIDAEPSEISSTDFLRRLQRTAPMKIVKLLTAHGRPFTDRLTSRHKIPSGHHAFDRECVLLGIEQRRIPPRHPQTHDRVERFNGRISEVLNTPRCNRAELLSTPLARYALLYHQRLLQKTLDYRTPIEAMQAWRRSHPSYLSKEYVNSRDPTYRVTRGVER